MVLGFAAVTGDVSQSVPDSVESGAAPLMSPIVPAKPRRVQKANLQTIIASKQQFSNDVQKISVVRAALRLPAATVAPR